MQSGTLVHRIATIHAQYGPVVRLAPNELSFIDPAACQDIYAARSGKPNFPKNPVWMGEPSPRQNSIVDANDHDHEPLLQQYVNKFISQLRIQGDGAVVDLVQWFNFLTFDLTGDLAFGESFGCLDGGTLHPWIERIFAHFKSATLLASTRFYPTLHKALIWSLPASVLKKQQEHFQMARDKVQKRLNLEQERPDFLDHVVEHNDKNNDDNGLTRAEIEQTAATMIVAGSETTGTLLSALINHLIKQSRFLNLLADEIRSSYSSEKDINLASLAKLPYLEAVIREGLRIAPPVPAGMPRVVPAGGALASSQYEP
ncbi:hypothetical protein G7Y79_00043g079060 [Physcia stellaris]|nr:hypothetical protein G7Y79_00043g079060 [Physcia stellaris]